MKLLAVDTALGACSVAVLEDDAVLVHRLALMERGHAEALAPMVEEAMAAAGLHFAAIDRLAVTTGPGTFTGQRVGLAFMRGLRVALDKPLVGVTTLSAMAQGARAETGLSLAAALHDARRNEVYLQIVGGAPMDPIVLSFEEAVARIAERGEAIALAGTAAPAAHERLPNTNSYFHPPARCAVGGAAGEEPGRLRRASEAAVSARAGREIAGAEMSVGLFHNGLDPAPLAAIHAQCFLEAWSAKSLAELLATPGAFAFAAANGFILVRAAAGEAEVLTLAVMPEARRSGIGTALVEAAANHAHGLGAQALFLEVAVANLPALTLYRRLGFVEAGRRKGYYTSTPGKPEDALVLRSDLPLSPLGKSSAPS